MSRLRYKYCFITTFNLWNTLLILAYSLAILLRIPQRWQSDFPVDYFWKIDVITTKKFTDAVVPLKLFYNLHMRSYHHSSAHSPKNIVHLSHIIFIIIIFCCLAGKANATAPNIIIFFADDLGYGDVGYQGGDLPTPHIDSIAHNGVRFTDGYVTCPVCAPSRAGLLTGRYQQRFGFSDNPGPYQRVGAPYVGIPPSQPTLTERLQTLGYVTGIFGKTHDGVAEEQMAFTRWDEFFGFNNGASNYLIELNRSHNPIFHNRDILSHSAATQKNPRADLLDNGVIHARNTEYLTDSIGDAAVSFIKSHKQSSFLCYVPFNAIHGPFQAPQRLVNKFSDEPDENRRLVKAMLYSLDQNVGKVIRCVRNNKLMAQTLIIFLSDNGGHDFSPNTPLRGKKGTMWEGGIRVPFCMQWQGVIAAESMYHRPVSSLDILPTAIAAAGGAITPDWEFDGVNLLPYICQEKAPDERPHNELYWSLGPRVAIRDFDYKLVSNDGKTYHLFDLKNDGSEKNNLIESKPTLANRLRKKIENWKNSLPPNNSGWNPRIGPKRPDFGSPQSYHQLPQ